MRLCPGLNWFHIFSRVRSPRTRTAHQNGGPSKQRVKKPDEKRQKKTTKVDYGRVFLAFHEHFPVFPLPYVDAYELTTYHIRWIAESSDTVAT